MDIKPEDLAANGYQLNAQMEHNNIVPFIGLYLKKKTTVTICYNLFLIGLATILGFVLRRVPINLNSCSLYN